MPAFKLPANAQPYLAQMRAAEQYHNMPAGLLSSMALQESGFRADVIDGTVKGGAGEIGILQITPRWHPNVNPYDPFASIWYVAALMRDNYTTFGSWEAALAAYNWGPTVLRANGIDAAPSTTKAYIAAITGRVFA